MARKLCHLCGPRMPLKLKGKLYTTVVRPAFLYGSESWTMYNSYNDKLTAAEMKMLRILAGVTKVDHIKSSFIRGSLQVKELIADKLKKQQQSWWEHVKRRPPENPVQVAMAANISRASRRGRHKNSWLKQKQLLDAINQGSTRITRQSARQQQQQSGNQ